jgi:gluconate 2-dehydrogenase gamma chain
VSEPTRPPSAAARDLSRREALRLAGMAFGAASLEALSPPALDARVAAHVHQAVARERAGGEYRPQAFNEQEWKLLVHLAEMILPADDRSPSAVEVGAPEFIDFLASGGDELLRILTSGMLWLDREMRERTGSAFLEATREQQAEMLDLLSAIALEREKHRVVMGVELPGAEYPTYVASTDYEGFLDYTTEAQERLLPGVRFFNWVRRLVVDAYYTTPEGIADVGYQGNRYLRSYTVPEESLRYALERSPFADEPG